MNAIEVKGLCKRYGDFALQDLSFSLPSGSVLGLVGENGAGKSTAIKLMMNAAKRDGGTVRLLGEDNQSAAFSRVKQEIGVVLDEAYYPEVLTAKNVGSMMRRAYQNWDEACYESYLHRFKLSDRKAFKDFSKGMKMKLALAVALSHHPKLLILDEATSGLDPMAREEILDLFNDFTRDENHSVLLSSHIVSDLERVCDYIAFLHNGRLLLCEEKDALLEKYAVVRLSQKELADLPAHAVKGKKVGGYGVEALVLRREISDTVPVEHTTLEEIILFLAKGENA